VIGSDFENARLMLVDRSKVTIHNCLELLGVSAPESM